MVTIWFNICIECVNSDVIGIKGYLPRVKNKTHSSHNSYIRPSVGVTFKNSQVITELITFALSWNSQSEARIYPPPPHSPLCSLFENILWLISYMYFAFLINFIFVYRGLQGRKALLGEIR